MSLVLSRQYFSRRIDDQVGSNVALLSLFSNESVDLISVARRRIRGTLWGPAADYRRRFTIAVLGARG